MSPAHNGSRGGGNPREIEVARRAVLQLLARDFAARGMADVVPYLPRKLSPQHVETQTTESGHRLVRMRVFGRFSSYSARYDARTGDQVSVNIDALIKDSSRDLNQDEAIRVAAALLNPPEDAVLEIAEYDEAGGVPFFFVRWSHVHQGSRVEKDHIHAMINGRSRRVFSWSKRWHDVSTEARLR